MNDEEELIVDTFKREMASELSDDLIRATAEGWVRNIVKKRGGEEELTDDDKQRIELIRAEAEKYISELHMK